MPVLNVQVKPNIIMDKKTIQSVYLEHYFIDEMF